MTIKITPRPNGLFDITGHNEIQGISLSIITEQTGPKVYDAVIHLGDRKKLDGIIRANGYRSGSPEENRYFDTVKTQVATQLGKANIHISLNETNRYFLKLDKPQQWEAALRALGFDNANITTIKDTLIADKNSERPVTSRNWSKV